MGKFQNYELNEAQRKLLEIKNQRRNELRAVYWKTVTNPNIHASGEGGHLFDPALQRFQAMRVSHYEHFKPTPKTFFSGLKLILIPIIALGYAMKWERDRRESKYRNGEVSYRDRYPKFF